MKTTLEYLDAVREKLNIPSDYATAKALGVTRSGVSRWRTGSGVPDTMVCVRMAEILEIEPLEIIAATEHARANDEPAREFWQSVWEKSGGAYREGLEAVKGWQVGHPLYQGNGIW
jgi:transcriptional regulator with XRE-family HTH domain